MNIVEAHRVRDILNAIDQGDSVVVTARDGDDDITRLSGVPRHLCHQNAAFLGGDDRVEDAYLRLSGVGEFFVRFRDIIDIFPGDR